MAIDPAAPASAVSNAGFWQTLIPAISALAGVVVAGLIQLFSAFYTADTQRKHRLADERAERERKLQDLEADRRFARAMLARHLESYARLCAKRMWENMDEDEEHGSNLPDFPPWPKIAWELIGPDEMMRARDIEMQVDLQREWVNGDIEYRVTHDSEAREYYANAIARAGLDAWKAAAQMRIAAGVTAFSFPKNSVSFVEALQDRVAKVDARLEAGARRASKSDLDED